MRLLVINWFDWTHPLWGGAEVYLHEVFRRLAARGHEVTLLCSRYAGGAADEVLDGVRVMRRGNFWTFHLELPGIYWRELRREPWDCVFEYTNKVPMLTPLFIRRPLVAVAHHLFGSAIFEESPLPVAAYVYAMERLIPVFYQQTPWIAVSESTRLDLISLGISASRVHVVHNGLDETWLAPDEASDDVSLAAHGAPSMPPSGAVAAAGALLPPNIIYVGRLKRYKRVDTLIRALPVLRQQVPLATLDIVGEGPDRPRLQDLARRLGLGSDTVRFCGAVSEDEKWHLLRRAALLVQPSLKEGWGRTVLEAGACGVPAIASDVAGLRESVRNGETGLLVPPSDPVALAQAAARLLQNASLRNAMGLAARAWAACFRWDDAAMATEQLARRAATHFAAAAPPVRLGS